MKVSIDWLREFVNIEESMDEISHALTMVGLEVEGEEVFESIEGGLNGLVIGEVLTCEPHTNADKLSVTTVDIGAEAPSPIVCGAPNVAAGQKVVVATVGTTLYPSGGESFKIKKAKIRGEVSQGMICAEDEIGLGASHNGIMVLDTDLPNGTPAADYFEIKNDMVLEIGLTPNRVDAASHYGVARDVKALYNRELKFPDLSGFKPDITDRPIKLDIRNVEACPRYSGVTVSNITVKASPDWLQNRLKAIGLSPINNVVDITNYVLHSLGLPLHAFDADKIIGDTIVVDTLPANTPFVTLDGEERKLNEKDLMICNTEKPMCIAGVFGGLESGVSESTTSIFIEGAYFSPDYVRKTSQRHLLKTDAAFRFERGTDPNMTVKAVQWAALLVKELAGGEISSEVVDFYPTPVKNFEVDVKYKHINRLIGKDIAKEEVREILANLDIEVQSETEEALNVSVPPYRVDVQREADVIEEILRVHGYDSIEVEEDMGATFLAGTPDTDPDLLRAKVSEMLAGGGMQEMMTNSITNSKYAEVLDEIDADKNVVILNALSADLDVMRQTLICNGLEVIAHNINRRQNDLRFYEFGKTYQTKGERAYTEGWKLNLYTTGNQNTESWRMETRPSDFYVINEQVLKIFSLLGIEKYTTENLESSAFAYGISYIVNGKSAANIGLLNKKLATHFDVKQDVFCAELDWDLLVKAFKVNVTYKEISRFPEVRRDLSLVIDKALSFAKIEETAFKTERKLLKSMNVFDVYEGDKLEEGQKSYSVSFTLQSFDKTLNDKAIDKTMQRLMGAFERELNVLIRK